MGIERAQRQLDGADLVLWLGAPSEAPNMDNVVLVQAKADIVPPDPDAEVRVSSRTGLGINHLRQLLAERARALLPGEGDVVINARHRVALADCVLHLEEAGGASDPLIAAEGLRQARSALDRVTGKAGVEDMLDSLFSRFCIGK
jgi:tRNA modification GTPase